MIATKTVHIALYDGLADWEIGHVTPYLRKNGCQVITVAQQPEPVTTMGGLSVLPDRTLDQLRPQDSAMLVLPGAGDWERAIPPFAAKAREFLAAGVPVAAICGATSALAAEGLLDDRKHTSSVAPVLEMTGYAGGAHYREADAVTDRDVITAGPTEPVAFAREILARLELLEPAVLDAWFRLYAHSDVSAYEVAVAAEGAGGAAG
ncbi:DJ-1/PfpI family protein [Streptomyces gobiensis]|uniref:DJ-1/PfpI family protein n=1 Tax=Streptomyces gobiensis TaxID=2875706 RepID=UPI001E5D04D8|nr:DJ-1/PfpI family protein [Streptomyces gobiensis]UGY92733.1 DJ-1/PfpI family protein [Streptomyces gobiensis]